MKLRYTRQAHQDLLDIYDAVVAANPSAAERIEAASQEVQVLRIIHSARVRDLHRVP